MAPKGHYKLQIFLVIYRPIIPFTYCLITPHYRVIIKCLLLEMSLLSRDISVLIARYFYVIARQKLPLDFACGIQATALALCGRVCFLYYFAPSESMGCYVLFIAVSAQNLYRDSLIENYFKLGMDYSEILSFLLLVHGIRFGIRHLKRRESQAYTAPGVNNFKYIF